MRNANEIATIINASGVKAEVTEVNRNGVTKIGIMLGEDNCKPIVYVNDYDNKDMSDEEVAANMIKRYDDAMNQNLKIDDITKNYSDWSWIKERVIPYVISADIEGAVHRDFLDLKVYYKVPVMDDGTVTIKNDHVETWGITEDDLYNAAVKNVKDSFTVCTIEEALGIPDMMGDNANMMLVITNKNKLFGASAILFTEIFEQIKDRFNDDVYIIPSSIHELLAVPFNKGTSNELTEMVMCVNDTEVSPEERLSNHVYTYINGKVGF